MFSVAITGDRELIQRFAAMPQKVHDALVAEITRLAMDLQRHVITDKLSGQVLRKITGRLQSSIQHDVTNSGTSVIGRVYSNNSVNYAAIHEFGGPVPDRYAKNGKVMHWMSGGKDVFATFAKGFQMPERSFLRSSLADFRERIINGMTAAVQKAVGG